MIFLGQGVNRALKSFGTTLLRKFGTERMEDYTRQWLGFSTDNGAYYYYGWHTGHANGNDYQVTPNTIHARFRTLFYRRSSLNHVVRHGVVRMR